MHEQWYYTDCFRRYFQWLACLALWSTNLLGTCRWANLQMGIAIISCSALLALCEGNPPVTGGFPSQRASNAEIMSTVMVSSWVAIKISKMTNTPSSIPHPLPPATSSLPSPSQHQHLSPCLLSPNTACWPTHQWQICHEQSRAWFMRPEKWSKNIKFFSYSWTSLAQVIFSKYSQKKLHSLPMKLSFLSSQFDLYPVIVMLHILCFNRCFYKYVQLYLVDTVFTSSCSFSPSQKTPVILRN